MDTKKINFEDFIMEGEFHLIERLNDFWYDLLPVGWGNHYVDEIHDFGDGFYTTVDYEGEKILYHIFVDPKFEGRGVGTIMLLDAYDKKGVRKIFDPNDECIELIKHVEFKFGIEFENC